MAFDPGSAMQKVVASNHLSIGIRKEGVSVTASLTETSRNVRRIYADRNGPHAQAFEYAETSFYTPQLGVAEWSPVAAVEHQQDTHRDPSGARRSANRSGEQFR
jgi:hypothetical protein